MIDKIQELTSSINNQVVTTSTKIPAQARLSLFDAFNSHGTFIDLHHKRKRKTNSKIEIEEQNESPIRVRNEEVSSDSVKTQSQGSSDEEETNEPDQRRILKKKSVKNLKNLKYIKGDS